jgi:hypothetical protein
MPREPGEDAPEQEPTQDPQPAEKPAEEALLEAPKSAEFKPVHTETTQDALNPAFASHEVRERIAKEWRDGQPTEASTE